MTVRRKKRGRKYISWIIILILLIVAGIIVYLVWNNYFNEEKKDENDKQELSVVIEEKDIIGEENKKEEQKVEKEEVVQYDGKNPNMTSGLTGVITYAGVVSEKIVIRVNINQYLSDGKCVLKILNGKDEIIYSDEAKIVSSASTSTCEGFDILKAEFEEGTYSIIVDLNTNEKKGTISGEVTI